MEMDIARMKIVSPSRGRHCEQALRYASVVEVSSREITSVG